MSHPNSSYDVEGISESMAKKHILGSGAVGVACSWTVAPRR